MIDRIEITPAVSLLLLVLVLELVRRRKLIEEYSILWMLSSIALLILSLRRQLLDDVARRLGASSSLEVPVGLLIVMVVAASLSFSVVVSRQRRQIERLVEETAILAAELRELRDRQSHAPDSAAVVPSRTQYLGPVKE